jgi:nicotinamidase-related amidase
MQASLLLIDPQNDFCDLPGAALPVPGADADMQRAAAFLHSVQASISDVVITLDTHPTVAIERTSFWKQGNGEPLQPFTEITEHAVRDRQYVPRNEALLPEVLRYLQALEAGRRYKLMVWPIHCVLGTWGHNIHSALAAEIAAWEERQQRGAVKVLKGQNPMTEQYSAIRAEVPHASDPQTQTNRLLITRARPREGLLLVAGEAASHCVAATMEHLFEELSIEELARVVILKDCMSPVAGFEAQAERFFENAGRRGARIVTSAQARALLD